jgi:hypothetical protein
VSFVLPESGAAMLDVHVPHATHTWQDFLIHIGTIVVGLFIAIGLEQTVEAIHHARERQELIDEMRAEAEQNIAVLHANLEVDVRRLQLDLALIALLRAAQPRDGIVTIVRPPHTAIMHQYPARAIWTSAKANGKVALLSDRQSAIYDRLDLQRRDGNTALRPYGNRWNESPGRRVRARHQYESGQRV